MGKGLLELEVWQHFEQEADQLLRELILEHPEDKLLQKGVVGQPGSQGRAILELQGWFRVGEGVNGLKVLFCRAAHEVGVV